MNAPTATRRTLTVPRLHRWPPPSLPVSCVARDGHAICGSTNAETMMMMINSKICVRSVHQVDGGLCGSGALDRRGGHGSGRLVPPFHVHRRLSALTAHTTVRTEHQKHRCPGQAPDRSQVE